jgi:hypothetical protein
MPRRRSLPSPPGLVRLAAQFARFTDGGRASGPSSEWPPTSVCQTTSPVQPIWNVQKLAQKQETFDGHVHREVEG